MKKSNVRIVASIIEILIGLAILISSLSVGSDNEYWGGMGTALIFVGAIFLFRQIKYQTNDSYRESVDVEVNDERNRYLGMRAWAWAGYSYVIAAAVASIVLKIMGKDDLSVAAGLSVAFITLFYWLSYLCLRKKY